MSVTWGETLCDLCRVRPADCLLERQPLCLGCADLTLERLALPAVLEKYLPSLRDEVRE